MKLKLIQDRLCLADKICFFTDKYVGAKLEVFIYDYQLQKVMEVIN